MKKMTFLVAAAIALMGCGGAKTTSAVSSAQPQTTAQGVFIPTTPSPASETMLQHWPHRNLFQTGFPGLSLSDAYALLEGRKAQKVVVGVIDSGVDINHEDFKGMIWTNPKEIAGNGKDDDKNGYIDDIHGWNFLGDVNEETLEMTRIVRTKNTADPLYATALEAYNKELEKTQKNLESAQSQLKILQESDALLQQKTGKSVYTLEDITKVPQSYHQETIKSVAVAKNILSKGETIAQQLEKLEKRITHFQNKLKYNLNQDFSPRKDDYKDINQKVYGNNNVIGPVLDGALHGTHVAGIIGALRGNNLGGDGVSNAVEIMCIRAIPDGDEYDKDIALAIRYAVDNGAKVINTSFGKAFSPNVEWVREAIKYAASKDVLIVNAAGNDSKNIDTDLTFPDDNIGGVEFADNMITIGALNYQYNDNLLARFSNYGKNNVDIFAPGVKVYATAPDNKYEFLQGTSMASPEVAGLAAMLRAYFPKLTAKQVKHIIMESGLEPNVGNVIVGGKNDLRLPMSEVCKSGKIANAYNAVLMALSYKEKK